MVGGGGGGIIQGGGGYVICSPVAMGDTSRDTQGGGILAVVTQSDLSRRLRIMAGGGGYAICSGGHG